MKTSRHLQGAHPTKWWKSVSDAHLDLTIRLATACRVLSSQHGTRGRDCGWFGLNGLRVTAQSWPLTVAVRNNLLVACNFYQLYVNKVVYLSEK